MSLPHDVSPAISQLGDCLAQAAESQRQLFQEIAYFARDEGLRFANLRLERNGQALEKMQNCHGLPGLIGVQQEWLRAFMQDYMAQQMRLAGAFRGLAHDVVASAAETASENIDRMHQEGREMAHAAGEQVNEMADTINRQTDQMAQEADSFVQQTQH
jgi:ElaB/YqjD/DUF883 family membrane-anchored ribosome-binding protein